MTEQPVTPDKLTGPDIWEWNGNNPPPSTGQFRSDTRNWTSATQLWFAKTDSGGTDQSAQFAALKPGDTVHVEFADNPANFHDWTVNTIVDQSGDSAYVLAVADAGSGGSQAAGGQSCAVSLTASGGGPTPSPDAEPLYGPKDVARALETSGERALAHAYFTSTGTVALPKSDADALIQAIKTGSPPPEAPQAQAAAAPQSESEPVETPPEGASA